MCWSCAKNRNIKCKPWNLHDIRSFNVSLTRKSKDKKNWILFYQPLFMIVSKIFDDFLILGAYIVLEMKDLYREFHINPQGIGVTSVFCAYLFFAKLFLTRAFAIIFVIEAVAKTWQKTSSRHKCLLK